MKAKIDCNGWLIVERAGKTRAQYCPYSSAEGMQPCGDWCPKFEEHFYYSEGPRVTVCGGPTYEIVADERRKEAADAPE